MFNRRLLSLLCCFWLFLLSSPVVALEVPPLKSRVNDTAGMFSQQVVSQTENILSQFEASDSTQIVVLTVPSLEGDILEEYSMRVVEEWKIGQKGLDNGALLLITRDDRRLRIEVGYGLEGSLTDLTAGRIIGQVIVPNFKKGDFDAGLSAGVQAMIQAVHGEFTASEAAPSKPQGSDPSTGRWGDFSNSWIYNAPSARNVASWTDSSGGSWRFICFLAFRVFWWGRGVLHGRRWVWRILGRIWWRIRRRWWQFWWWRRIWRMVK